MCTSKERVAGRGLRGFTAIELLLGLTLTVVLALAIMSLTVTLEGLGARESDRTIAFTQGRVAAARIESDLRLATAGGSPFRVESAVLEAGPTQVVFLGHADDDASIDLIEWELTEDRLMRRWGPCPAEPPSVFGHHLFADNKTLLEDLCGGATISYVVKGRAAPGPIPREDLYAIEAVILRLSGEDDAGPWPDGMVAIARVGR